MTQAKYFQKTLNIEILKKIFYFSCKGYNKTQQEKKIGVHRVTIQRYHKILRTMSDKEFKYLMRFTLQ